MGVGEEMRMRVAYPCVFWFCSGSWAVCVVLVGRVTEVSQGSTLTQGSLSSQFGCFSKELG